MKGNSWPVMVAIGAILLATVACGSSGDNTPTAPPAGGLGLDRAAFERAHPKGFEVQYQDGRAMLIEWTHAQPVSPEQVRQEVAALFPADSKLIRTYHPEGVSELTVDLYSSPWLAGRFPDGPWPGGSEPGQFILIFAVNGGKAQRVILATGNNQNEPPTPNAAGTPAAPILTQPSIPSNGPTVKTAANLRAGPGTNYAKNGSAAVGQALDIIGRNTAGDWYQLASGAWIAAFLVSNAPASIPVAAVVPTPAVVAPSPVRAVAVPTARGLPAAAASDCDCDHGNTLNCDDFTDWDAQACYLRCMELKKIDVHGLDRDSDGNACEWEN